MVTFWRWIGVSCRWFDEKVLNLPDPSHESISGFNLAAPVFGLALAQAGALIIAAQGKSGSELWELESWRWNWALYIIGVVVALGTLGGMYFSTTPTEGSDGARRTFDGGTIMALRWLPIWVVLILGGSSVMAFNGLLPGQVRATVEPTRFLNSSNKITLSVTLGVDDLNKSRGRIFLLLAHEQNLDWDLGSPKILKPLKDEYVSRAGKCYNSPAAKTGSQPAETSGSKEFDPERVQPRAIEIYVVQNRKESDTITLQVPLIYDDYSNDVPEPRFEDIDSLRAAIESDPSSYIKVIHF